MKIPNIISIFRIILIPFLFIFINNKIVFLTIVIIGGLTDLLDGIIARRFNLVSKLGARLDSIADNLFMISMIICLIILFPQEAKENIMIISLVILFYLIGLLLKFFILKKIVSTHLYSHKLTNWLGYILVAYTVLFGYNKLLITIIGIIYTIALIEEILIIVIRKDIDEDTKSLFIK